MEILKDYLPKDLINIVEEYSKDRTQYDNVLKQMDIVFQKSFVRNICFTRNFDLNHHSMFSRLVFSYIKCLDISLFTRVYPGVCSRKGYIEASIKRFQRKHKEKTIL